MEKVVLAYGDSNTHGTMPMATLEDTGRFGRAERWPERRPERRPQSGARVSCALGWARGIP